MYIESRYIVNMYIGLRYISTDSKEHGTLLAGRVM